MQRNKLLRVALLAFSLEFGAGLLFYMIYTIFFASGVGIAGRDFMAFWGGAQALLGTPAEAYDYAAFQALQSSLAGESVEGYPWLYPPPFFFAVAPLAILHLLGIGLTGAFLIWSALTLLPGPLLALLFGARRWAAAALLLAPVLTISASIGQVGSFLALFLGGGIALLDRRPLLSGILLSTLFCKPQLALPLIPALLAGGHLRAMLGTLVGGAGLLLSSALLFGVASWAAFFEKRAGVWDGFLSGTFPWSRMITGHAMGLSWGFTAQAALILQAGIALVSLVLALLVWRRTSEPFLLSLTLILATLSTTPYAYMYDTALLVVPLAVLIARNPNSLLNAQGSLWVALLLWFLPISLWILQNALGWHLWPVSCLLGLLWLCKRTAAVSTS